MEDVFRKEYKTLTEEQKAWMLDVKENAESLLFSMVGRLDKDERSERARLLAIAKTQLEITIAMAVKGITS